MNKLKICFFPLLILGIYSCTHEDVSPGFKVYHGEYLLQEIKENKKIKNLFTYDQDKLKTHTQIDSPVVKTFEYLYDKNSGRLDTIFVQESKITGPIIHIIPYYYEPDSELFLYKIVPVYKNDRFSEFYFYQDQFHYYKVVLDYDGNGKIVQLSQIYPSWGMALRISFIWDGDNIKSYEKTYNDGMEGITWVYEFEYDNNINPFTVVFRDFNFDFVRFLPFTKNNYVQVKEYRKDAPMEIRTYSYTFSYSGIGYPISRLASIEDLNGKRLQLYSSYKYRNVTNME